MNKSPTEETFRHLVHSIEEFAIVLLDPEGRVESWNTGAERIYGYRGDEILGESFSRFFPPESRAEPERALRIAAEAGRYESQGWRVRKNGSTYWSDVVLTPMRGPSGELTGYAKISRDLTRRKWEEDRFRVAVESAPNAMVMIDQEGKIILVNAQTEKLFGYSRDELLGRMVEMLVPERFRAKHPGYRRQFFGEPHTRAMGAGRDLFGLRKNGVEIPVEIGLNPIHTSEGFFVLAAIVDITERKRAEERFRIAVEAAPNAMVMVNAEGRIVLVNAQTEKLFGYRREELLGQLIEILVPDQFRHRHPGYRKAFYAAPATRAMGAGRDLYGRRKDGSQIPVEIGLNPVHSDEGVFVLAAIVDITERKRSETEVRRTATELSRSNKELQQFAYVASHDLQEPLRAVAGCLDLLRLRQGDQLDPKSAELMTLAVDGAKRMQTLINDLLAYSRVDTRGRPLSLVDMNRVFDAAKRNIDVSIRESGAKITNDPLPSIKGDETQLVQLIQNLLANAVKFRREDPPVVHFGFIDGADWTFYVRDNGIGIESEYYDRIFQIFQRLHTQRKYPGTGIGLAICKKIVDRHGGRIWVESEPGKGSTFYFTIPKGAA